jgi:hypothetical protein
LHYHERARLRQRIGLPNKKGTASRNGELLEELERLLTRDKDTALALEVALILRILAVAS